MLTDHSHKLRAAVSVATIDIRETGRYHAVLSRPSGSAHYGKEKPSDYDVLVLVRETGVPGFVAKAPPENLEDFIARMGLAGWKDCAEDGNTSGGDTDAEDYRVQWCALRQHDINIIATTDEVWFYRQCAASELCRSMSQHQGEAISKEETIRIFRIVREGIVEGQGNGND